MNENSVIKHYKKQLIYRQHDVPDQNNGEKNALPSKEIDDNQIYEFLEGDAKNNNKISKNNNNNNNNGKKIRRKRKNKNCRGQFRHEGMELIKLGTNTTHSLCKTKEPYHTRTEKPSETTAPKEDQNIQTYQQKADKSNETNKKSVIQTNNFADKTIILENSQSKPPIYGHALPQMVPERRNSREMIPSKVPTMAYGSPPHPPMPEYRVPMHPYLGPHPPFPPLPPNLVYPPYPQMRSPSLPPPPPYPLTRSPPQHVSRSPVRPVPRTPGFQKSPYSGVHFPIPHRHPQYNGYTPPKLAPNPPISVQNTLVPQLPHQYPSERKKRKQPFDDENLSKRTNETPSVIAAIDLTVDQNHKVEKVPQTHHKCHCECGKTYRGESVQREVIITVTGDRNSSQVPSASFRGKMVNGILQLENQDTTKPQIIQQNGNPKKNHEAKTNTPPVTKVPENKTSEGKLPQLFLIKDLLAKGVRVEKKSSHNRIQEEAITRPAIIEKTSSKDTRPVPSHAEPNRVIVSTKQLGEPKRKSQDHSVSNIIGTDNNRRQSVDIDTISISSSSSESLRSPKPKTIEKQIPHGKLFYYKYNNSFIRYYDDTQKKLFMDNLIADGTGDEIKQARNDDNKEVIELPRNTMFSSKDSLTVEEYVTEMTLVEKFIPRDFFLFYKFVTGYQICNNNLPVSFLTFLKVYNTNGLKILLDRYVSSLKTN